MTKNRHNLKVFYRGFEIIIEGCDYKIKGFAMIFYTLSDAKRHIDFMKLDKPTIQTSIHI